MWKLLMKICILISLLIIIVIVLVVLVPPQYDKSFQRIISVQYDSYKKMGAGKIVAIGGSSLVFGYDADHMKELTGKECQILGVHAAMGQPYVIEMAKSNIQEGDIIIIEFINDRVDKLGVSLLLTGIENNYEMYKFFTLRNWIDVIKGYPSYVSKKINYWLFEPLEIDEVYSVDAFDKKGNMTGNLDECVLPDPYPTIDVENSFLKRPFNEDFIAYLNEFDKFCKDKGATLLITQKSYFDEAVDFKKENMDNYDKELASLLTAPLISDFEDYIFAREHISNGSGHCNKRGAIIRTEKIYEDMTKYFDLIK